MVRACASENLFIIKLRSKCVQYVPNMRLRSSPSIVVDLPGFATTTLFGTANFDAERGKSSGPSSQFLVNFALVHVILKYCCSQILILANSDIRNSRELPRHDANCSRERRTKSS